ncbi:MAG TPA: PIG-L deacetylase family protein [Actinomycetales bacterium]|nr:PIG-L deacetylase family protein [Actinomycetales bacterium]
MEIFDDSEVRRVLAVAAHPDDMEYGGSAAVARWTAAGVDVSYALVTSGEAGMDSVAPVEAGPLREAEQRAACAAVGVQEVTFMGFPDGILEYGLPLRRAVAEQVRIARPDLVVTGAFRDTWPGGYLNQSDHVAVGRAVLDAVRDAGNRWVFPEQLAGDLEPWGGVRTVLALGSPSATHAIVADDTFEAAVRSLEAHGAYLAALGDGTTNARDVLEQVLGHAGPKVGARYAVAAEVFRM